MRRHSRESKLAHLLEDASLARALIAAGFDRPRKIKEASDEDLQNIEGIGKAKRDRIRERFPKGKR